MPSGGHRILDRRTRKSQATRKAIFDAGMRLFAERGFEAPTIDDIAKAADVGKGTYYNYFASKEEILVVHMIETERVLAGKITRFAETPGPLEKILCEVVRSQLRHKKANFAFHQIFLAALMRHGPGFTEHLIRMQEHVDPPMRSLFERLQARRLIRPDIDISEAVFTFKCIQLGVFAIWSMTGPIPAGAMQAAAVQIAPFARFISGGKS